MNAPPPVSPPPPTPPATRPGSSADQGAAVGFLLAWAVAVGASVAGIAIGAAAAFLGPAAVPILILCAVLPLGSVIGLIVWFSTQRRPRAMRGAIYALLSQIVLLVLVVGGLLLLFANADFR